MLDLANLGFKAFSTPPELHTEIVLAVWTNCADDKFTSVRSLEFVRGWYTTWITGPQTVGCGIHGAAVCALFPDADREWAHEFVFLHDPCWQVPGETIAGVLPESQLDSGTTYWQYADKSLGERYDLLELNRGSCKTRLRHNGVFFPRRPEQT